jgi:hypothetical protein
MRTLLVVITLYWAAGTCIALWMQRYSERKGEVTNWRDTVITCTILALVVPAMGVAGVCFMAWHRIVDWRRRSA